MRNALCLLALCAVPTGASLADTLPLRDVAPIFAAAEAAGRVGLAQKTRSVDARPAVPGEIVLTIIAGEGKETQSRPARADDKLVRNRCPDTGNEQYLVSAATFEARYREVPGGAEAEGWREYTPVGPELQYFILEPADGGDFLFTAPWGEDMVARVGDAIVRDPNKPRDTYRVAAASFACTYEVR